MPAGTTEPATAEESHRIQRFPGQLRAISARGCHLVPSCHRGSGAPCRSAPPDGGGPRAGPRFPPKRGPLRARCAPAPHRRRLVLTERATCGAPHSRPGVPHRPAAQGRASPTLLRLQAGKRPRCQTRPGARPLSGSRLGASHRRGRHLPSAVRNQPLQLLQRQQRALHLRSESQIRDYVWLDASKRAVLQGSLHSSSVLGRCAVCHR